MTGTQLVEIIAALTMPIGLIVLFINRLILDRGIGARAIQFSGVTIVFPAIIILGLEGKIGAETLAALLGAAVGYLLSGIANYDLTRMVEKLTKTEPAKDDE